jgi:hypothetical protein
MVIGMEATLTNSNLPSYYLGIQFFIDMAYNMVAFVSFIAICGKSAK